jgi:transposase
VGHASFVLDGVGSQQEDLRDHRGLAQPADRSTGSPWRDLPEVFGEWNSVFRRFSRWSRKDVWWRIFEAMSDDPDFEYLIVDSTIVRVHQHAAGAQKGGLKIGPSAVRAAA